VLSVSCKIFYGKAFWGVEHADTRLWWAVQCVHSAAVLRAVGRTGATQQIIQDAAGRGFQHPTADMALCHY
jgi:hypothetical protein